MSTVVRNTPSLLIPKELFKEEKKQEYWNVLHPVSQYINMGTDDLEGFYLLYPNLKNEDAIHEISAMYQDFKKHFSDEEHAICINVYDEGFSVLVLKNRSIAYTGYFRYSVKEDILYHLTNISQQFFEAISKVIFVYQQLTPTILRLLENYYEMKKI